MCHHPKMEGVGQENISLQVKQLLITERIQKNIT
jgi:hypothetical protein